MENTVLVLMVLQGGHKENKVTKCTAVAGYVNRLKIICNLLLVKSAHAEPVDKDYPLCVCVCMWYIQANSILWSLPF